MLPQEARPLVVHYDVHYAHAMPQLESKIRELGYTANQVVLNQIKRFHVPDSDSRPKPKPPGCGSRCGCHQDEEAKNGRDDDEKRHSREVKPEVQKEESKKQGGPAVLFIGEDGPTLTNLLIGRSQAKVWRYSPENSILQREEARMNRALMRRYFLVEKTKDADIIGIVAGTLGVSKYLQIIDHMKRLIRDAGKKYYTFVVGKLNPQKLANFEHVDIFVLVACPENSLIDSKDFYKPIITPYELELALSKGKTWTGEYITDYSEILASVEEEGNNDDEGKTALDEVREGGKRNEDEPRLSLVDGKLKPNLRPKDADLSEVGQELVVSGGQSLAVTVPTAASFLAQRHWKGLEQKLGETEVKLAEEGRAGLPKGYTHSGNESHV